MFGAGVYLIYRLRMPMLAFTSKALIRDRSMTVPGFIARQHGNDRRLRLLAATVSICAFAGMIASAAFAVASLLKPMLPDSVSSMLLVASILLILMFLVAIPAGHSGVMRSAQMQLAILYLGLIGSALILLYMLLSTAGQMPPRGTLAVVILVVCCAIVLLYRRSRYIDTSPIGTPLSGDTAAAEPAGAGFFRRLSRVANEVIAVLAGTLLVIALIALYAQGAGGVPAESISALRIEMPASISGVLALVLVPLLYPIVDSTNWLRIAALGAEALSAPAESGRAPETFARVLAIIGGASALVWLLICALGTIAILGTATPESADILRSFFSTLATQQTELADAATWLLLASVVAMVVLTGSAMFSAVAATIRYDVAPNISSNLDRAVPDQMLMKKRAVLAAAGLCVLVLIVLWFFNGDADLSFSGGRFLQMQVACVCAQLVFAPLVLAPLICGKRAAVGATQAITVIIAGLIAGQGVIVFSLQSEREAWLWSAIPACLAASLLAYAGAQFLMRKAASKA